jgi:hypothetical protein
MLMCNHLLILSIDFNASGHLFVYKFQNNTERLDLDFADGPGDVAALFF